MSARPCRHYRHRLRRDKRGHRRWLAQQTKKTRLLFVGRYFEGAELKELAAMFGMSEPATKSALHRARLSLRRELEAAEIPL